MELISAKEIVDVIKYGSTGAILVEKKICDSPNQYKAAYSLLNFETMNIEGVTKSAYLLKKFGATYADITGELPNFIQCDAATLYDRRTLIIYPNGEAGIFDREGQFEWNGTFAYNECPIRNLALEGKYFWSVCPKQNCVIRYSCQNMKVDLRIGGIDATTFIHPTHISFYGGDLYVSCDNNKIRRISGNDFTVSDYREFSEKVKRFYKLGKYEIAVLSSGTYIIDTEQ